MSHSYSRILIHLLFSTQNRRPCLTDDIRGELHAYIIGILRNLESPSIRTNSTADHVHIFLLQSSTQTLANIVEEVKRSSSKWLKTKAPAFMDFHWQIGYAAFSVGQTGVDSVIKYIDQQEEHHCKVSFVDEVRTLFRIYKQELDEKYFFGEEK